MLSHQQSATEQPAHSTSHKGLWKNVVFFRRNHDLFRINDKRLHVSLGRISAGSLVGGALLVIKDAMHAIVISTYLRHLEPPQA
jgi:hypothetical protein